MTNHTYKRLFEVQILHDYFLLENNTSFFAGILSEDDRKKIVNEQLLYGQLDMRKVFTIRPTKVTAEVLKNHKMRFISTTLGFLIGLEVTKQSEGNSQKYKPFIPIDKTLRFSFELQIKDTLFVNYSGIPLQSALPFKFYFTNKNEANDKEFPALARQHKKFTNKDTFEMGEAALFDNKLKEALVQNNKNQPENWSAIEGKGFVNRQDMKLLPHAFTYQLPKDLSLEKVKISLSNLDGLIQKEIVVTTTAKEVVSLDFNEKDQESKEKIPAGAYNLQIKGDNGLSIKKEVYLDETLFRKVSFGILDIFSETKDKKYTLLEKDGTIKQKVLANGQKESHPVFELRFRSRSTYWRYAAQRNFTTLEKKATATFLAEKNGHTLVTKVPKALAQKSTSFGSGISFLKLPTPTVSPLKYEPDGRIYSDIKISSINRLLKN